MSSRAPRRNFQKSRDSHRESSAPLIPFGTFAHKCNDMLVFETSQSELVPKNHTTVYTENSSIIGTIDEVFGIRSNIYYNVKPATGISPDSMPKDEKAYIRSDRTLQSARFDPRPPKTPKLDLVTRDHAKRTLAPKKSFKSGFSKSSSGGRFSRSPSRGGFRNSSPRGSFRGSRPRGGGFRRGGGSPRGFRRGGSSRFKRNNDHRGPPTKRFRR